MSNTTIQDGKTGRTAGVDSMNRVKAFAVSRPELTTSLINGDGFIITNSAAVPINLTTDSKSAVMYVENTDTVDWIINRFFVNTSPSDSDGPYSFELVARSTSGTIISGGTEIDAVNLNLGSPKLLTSNIKTGAEGNTVNGGVVVIDSIVPTSGARTAVANDVIVVPPGANMAVTVTPPTGNTDFDVQVGFLLHRTEIK